MSNDPTFAKDSNVVVAVCRDNGVDVTLQCTHAWSKDGEFGDTFLTEDDLKLMLFTIETGRAPNNRGRLHAKGL